MGLMGIDYDSWGNMGGADDQAYQPGLMQSLKNWGAQDKNKYALMQMAQAIGQPINGTRGATSSQNALGIISNMLGAYNQSNMGGYDQYKQQQEMQKLKTDDLRSQVDLRKANLAQMNAPAVPKSALDYISKLDPANYTPESFAAFGQSMNPADLRARSKVDIAPSGQVYDPYDQSSLGKNMGALKDFDMGQTRLFTRPDGTPVANLPMSQSPNSVASNQVSMRGQNMTDARAREFNGVTQQGNMIKGAPSGYRWNGSSLEPIPGGPAAEGKPMTDSQSKAYLFGTRMQESDKGLQGLPFGQRPSAIKEAVQDVPLLGRVLGPAANITLSKNQQSAEQYQNDFINAALRRESGAVIADSERVQAARQYFPQIGDSKEVVEQKARNRALATQGIMMEVPEAKRPSRRATDNASKGGFKILSVE